MTRWFFAAVLLLVSPLAAADPPAGARYEFTTDFAKHTVDYSEIFSGGPPKDGIPALDKPTYVSIADADAWLEPREPVVRIRVDETARAYPIQILMWHEIINDEVAGKKLSVTYCPLCNTAITFVRDHGSRTLDFGTTGRLRYSNMVMYDRQTETWWQQGTGEALAGELTGETLVTWPAEIIAWEDFKRAHPSGDVVSRETGHTRRYGMNPYVGYDDVDSSPFLYTGPTTPTALRPLERILALDLDGKQAAYPYDQLTTTRVVNDTVGKTDVLVVWHPGTASPLDALTTGTGRDVGAALAYSRKLGRRTLDFSWKEDTLVDDQTGSTWTPDGLAIDGPLAGKQLEPVVGVNHFWFSWAAFRPETRIWKPEG